MSEPLPLGNLLVIGVESARCDERVRRAIEVDRVGGVILFQRNLAPDLPPAETRGQLAEFLSEVRACAADAGLPTPFLMIDHEGGRVHRFGKSVTRFPPPGRLAALGGDAVAEVCRQQARELRAIGFNTVLGPVLDVCPAEGTTSHIGPRSFGGSPDQAAELSSRAIEAFLAGGILPVPKHFPGYGAAPLDPHHDLPTRTDTLASLVATDLVPFARATAEGCPAIMTAHIVATGLDAELPATLSPTWLSYLREELGFRGCVVSDDLCMASVSERYGPQLLAERCLRAGLDLLLVCHPSETSVAEIQSHLREAAASDSEFAARIQRALDHVAAARALLDSTPRPALSDEVFAEGEALRERLASQGATW
ncbi:MAG: glycoside hydrolase family 3 protein [Planctomycetes bacterium]|nr:glycoside hydrolase family 3 protein [Planctomycetota bacterium]